jgi:hypothetical protein
MLIHLFKIINYVHYEKHMWILNPSFNLSTIKYSRTVGDHYFLCCFFFAINCYLKYETFSCVLLTHGIKKIIWVYIYFFLISGHGSNSICRVRALVGSNQSYKIGICCFSAKHVALRRKSKDWLARNQNNVSEWSDMSTRVFKRAISIKIQLSVLIQYKADLIIISLKINLFSPWYSWGKNCWICIKQQSLTHYFTVTIFLNCRNPNRYL